MGADAEALLDTPAWHALTGRLADFSQSDPTGRAVRFDADVNVLGTLNLLEACADAGTRQVVFASTGGAIYGAASSGPRDAFLRPPNRLRSPRNLFLASGSAHPGGGVPLTLLSGLRAAQVRRRCIRVKLRTWSRTSSGAATIVL